jgi:hypothetical protein
MSGTKAKSSVPLSRILSGHRVSRLALLEDDLDLAKTPKITSELRLNLRMKDAGAAREPCQLAVAQDGKLR